MARPTVRTLSRYLLRQHLAPLGFALAALTSLMLLNQIAKQFGNLVGKGLPWSVIIEVFVLSIPFIVAVTLPMAVLVAVLHVFTRLASDNEITAMQASGISVWRVVVPVLGGAAVVAALSFLWSDQLLPRSNHRLKTLQVDIQRKKPSFALKEQVINEVVPGQFFLRATRIDPNSNKLKDVTIYDLGDAERRRIIGADSGRMGYTPGGRDLYLTLLDGNIEEVNRSDPAQINRTYFRTNRMRVQGIGNSLVRTEHDTYKSDREMSVCEMEAVVARARQDGEQAREQARTAVQNDLRRLAGIAPFFPTPAFTPGSESEPWATGGARGGGGEPGGAYCRALRRLGAWLAPKEAAAQAPGAAQATPAPPRPPPTPSPLITPGATIGEEQRMRSARQRAATYAVEIHKKYAIAAACIVFALVGAPVALRFRRGGVGLVIGMSLVVFVVYYIGLIGGEDLGDRLIVSPFLAMWTPNMIFTVVGFVGLWRMRRPGNTPHGGDWGDILPWLWRRARG
jgi:lipopolysaccharide export system permease protein